MVGVEALVRWEHPERGRIGPDDFIRVAEESDSILEIGRWVLSQACRQVRAWHGLVAAGLVHDERQHLGTAAGPARFRRRGPGRSSGRPASSRSEIVLEMTETSMLQDIATTRAKLQELRDAGIGVSIDDFGTGYSSLSYLQRFPVTTLKIARDFVDVDRRRRGRVGARQRDRGARAGAAAVGHRRRRRAVVAARPPADAGLRVRPGLLLRAAARPGRRSSRCSPTAAS